MWDDDDGCIEPSKGGFKFPTDIPKSGQKDLDGEDNLSLSTDR